jgi:dCTP deaminase
MGGSMSILTRDEILKRIRAGQIRIEPFAEVQVGPASIDLHLGNDFRVFKEIRHPFDVTEHADLDKITEQIHIPDHDSLMLLPGKTCLGITVEHIKLPPNVCGWLQGRSRFARLGLVIHATASFIQPGIDNRQVLEITNNGQVPLNMIPKVAICQLILQECVGQATYSGRFRAQTLP